MFEKVNPSHPDKVADRIAGAIVDLAYKLCVDPKIAVEVLIGHGVCNIIIESNLRFEENDIMPIVNRITGIQDLKLNLTSVAQDQNLSNNQSRQIKCGDNGIFKGVYVNDEELALLNISKKIYRKYPTDGKYILDKTNNKLVVCQSNANEQDLAAMLSKSNLNKIINPLGYWTGGVNVDSGATNRKLGSDMGRGVTGGGLHGKDLSKADVSVNIYAHLLAQHEKRDVELCCAIGDEEVCGVKYQNIVNIAKAYIEKVGGFEKFAEWGLIR